MKTFHSPSHPLAQSVSCGSIGQDAEDHWRNMATLSADYWWEMDSEFRLMKLEVLNEGASWLFEGSDSVGKHLWEIGFDLKTDNGWDAWQERLELHEPFRDVVLQRGVNNDSACYVSISGAPQFDENNRFSGYHGIARDVTEAQRLHNSLVRFRTAMDQCGDSVYLVDRGTMRFIDVNATAVEKMGYTREELLRMGPADLLKMPIEEIEKSYDAVIAAGDVGLKTESQARTKGDEAELIAEMHRRPLQDGNNWIIVSIARDITQRKQAENALNERNVAMRLVLDNIEQGLLMLDKQGNVLPEYSAAFEAWFGAPEAGHPFGDFLARIDEVFGVEFSMAFEQCLDGILPLDLCISQAPKVLHQDGRYYEFSYRAIVDDAGELTGMLVVVADKTAERERERLVSEQRETLTVLDKVVSDRQGFTEFATEAEELLVAISDWRATKVAVKRAIHTLKGNCMIFGVQSVADLCHDIESEMDDSDGLPLNGQVEKLKAGWEQLCRSLATIMGDRDQSLLEIGPEEFNAILEAALDERDHQEIATMLADLKLEPTVTRLQRVSGQAKSLAARLHQTDIDVIIEDSGLRLDPHRWAGFWSAFVHVVRNAVDHGLGNRVRHQEHDGDGGRLTLNTQVEGEEFVISIQDNGLGIDWKKVGDHARRVGMPCDTRAELEEALFTDGMSTMDVVSECSGRGVGLSAIRAACAANRGTIEIDSQIGCGTTFTFRFPRETMAATPSEYLKSGSCR